jgi:membrane-associated phospholipid phosphatase
MVTPVALAHGKHWIPTLAVLGTTAALVVLDPHEGAYFRRTTAFDGFNRAFSSNNTSLGIILPPASLYFAGLIRGDSKMKSTALLAGEALADAEIVATVFKDADRRLRPAGVPPNGNFSDTWFEDNTRFLRSNGSFPSGHSIGAFAIATVIARRYGNHRWVPYIAYGGAALIGFSRLPLSAHFASDVFMGGALGYSIARFTVLRQ